MHKIMYLFIYNTFIKILYIFRAAYCSKHVEDFNKCVICKQIKNFVHQVGN
jgi:hypothetical protein